MRRLNRILAAIAIAVLIATLWLLAWLRENAVREMERSIVRAATAIEADAILHGPGGDTLVRFDRLEAVVAQMRQSPSIRDAVVTKAETAFGGERPIVPYTFAANHGPDWQARLETWRRNPLGNAQRPFGYLYLDVDRSALTTINLALWSIGLSILLLLVALLARLMSQETSLRRTVVELNERRNELIRLERLALAGQLAAGLLHDLRKPVLNIQHSLDEVEDALGDFAPAARSVQDLRHQTRLFFQILKDSQIERFVQSDRAGEEYIQLGPILDFSLNLVRYERRGVEVERREADDLPLLAHPYRLIQLFSNLILNAYQALDGRGHLEIEAVVIERELCVRFIDDGPGIPADVADRIFDPFFTTKSAEQGTGLGLSICRMIVEEMDGRLTVDSRPGGPTTFSVWLPIEQGT